MAKYIVHRWAVIRGGVALVGKYYWADATKEEPQIRTFTTRTGCREAIKRTQHDHTGLRPVKVRVTIEEM